MATVYSANYNQRFINEPAENIPVKDQGARVRRYFAIYEIAAGILDTDVIKMIQLPKGAVISKVKLSHPSALGAGTTLSVGHAGNSEQVADPDAFLAAVDSSTASDADMGGNMVGYNLELAEATDIEIVVGGANFAGGATGTVIRLEVYAVID